MAQLCSSVQGGAQELSKLADECIAILRGETQVSCFHYLQALSTMRFSEIENTRGSFVARSLKSYSGDEERARAAVESEVGITALHQHLFAYARAALTCGSPELVAVIISPLCTVVPKILSVCAKIITKRHSDDTEDVMGLFLENLKTRFMRAILACQHMLVALIEEAHVDPRTQRLLQDIVSDDFDVARRVAEKIDMREASSRNTSPVTIGAATMISAPSPASTSSETASQPSMKPRQVSPTRTGRMERFFESVSNKFANK